MKLDRSTSRVPRTAQVLLNVLVAIALVALGSVVSIPAAAASTDVGEPAAWPARWSDYTRLGGKPIADVDGDVTQASLDLASDCPTCTGPSRTVAWASDGSSAFFRLRLATDISGPAERGSLGEAYLVQIADARGEVRAVVGVNRTGAQHFVYVSNAAGDVVVNAYQSPLTAQNPVPVGSRVVRADEGSKQSFLDFQVPLRLIETVSRGAVNESTPIRLYYGSAAAADVTTHGLAAITADFMLGDVTEVDFSTLATVTLAPLRHQVAFDSAGGSDTADSSVAEGFPVAEPAAPTRTGHDFAGWFRSASGAREYDFSEAITASTTVHAQWTPDSYLVTFDSAGGSAVAEQTVDHGATVAVPADPTRDDDTFLGWFTDSSAGVTVDLGTQPMTGPTSVFAHWRTNAKRDLTRPDTAPPAHAPAVTSAEPGAESHPAEVAAKGGGAAEDVTATIVGATSRDAGNQTTYPVVFYPNGGSGVKSQNVVTGDTAAVPAEPNRAGYAFKGWFATADGAEKWDFAAPIKEATALYAHWTADAGVAPGSGAGNPAGDTDCADYATSAEATEAMGLGDPDGLDRDDDGIACDSLPAGDSGDTGDDAGQDDGRNGGAALPNTGNQVPEALLPVAYLVLLLGLALMTRNRRRLGNAALGPA